VTRNINCGSHALTAPRQEWRTPRLLASLIVGRWNIDLDAMAHAGNAIVPRFFAPLHLPEGAVALDASAVRWSDFGRNIFVNPPFASLGKTVQKAVEASEDGCTVVLLAPDNGDTKWYAAIVDAGAHVLRFRGRVQYEPAAGVSSSQVAFPSALYVLVRHVRRPRGGIVPTFAICPQTMNVL